MLVWIPLVQFVAIMFVFHVIVPLWSYWRGKSVKPPQFTIRTLLLMTLICASLVATFQALERLHSKKIREIKEWQVNAIRENNERTANAIRESEERWAKIRKAPEFRNNGNIAQPGSDRSEGEE